MSGNGNIPMDTTENPNVVSQRYDMPIQQNPGQHDQSGCPPYVFIAPLSSGSSSCPHPNQQVQSFQKNTATQQFHDGSSGPFCPQPSPVPHNQAIMWGYPECYPQSQYNLIQMGNWMYPSSGYNEGVGWQGYNTSPQMGNTNQSALTSCFPGQSQVSPLINTQTSNMHPYQNLQPPMEINSAQQNGQPTRGIHVNNSSTQQAQWQNPDGDKTSSDDMNSVTNQFASVSIAGRSSEPEPLENFHPQVSVTHPERDDQSKSDQAERRDGIAENKGEVPGKAISELATLGYVMNAVVVSELNPNCSQEDFTNYIESVADADVDQIKYTEDHSTAVVFFKNDTDNKDECSGPQKLLSKQITKKLYGRIPGFSTLDLPFRISVEGFDPNTTANEIQEYFESAQSGNDCKVGVKDVDIRYDSGYSVVTFANKSVVEKVMSKTSHKLCGKEIEVHECYQVHGTMILLVKETAETNTEIVSNLQLVELRLLRILDYFDTCMKKCRNLKVITDERTQIVFQGPHWKIDQAKVKLSELRNEMQKYKKSLNHFSNNKLYVLTQLDIEEYIVQRLKEEQIQGAWQIDSDKKTIIVMAMSQSDLRKITEILEKSLIETNVNACLSSAEYEKFEKELQQRTKQTHMLFHQDDSVLIVATDAVMKDLEREAKTILQKLKRVEHPFASNDTVRKTTAVRLSPLVARYLYCWKGGLLDKMSTEFNVQFQWKPDQKALYVDGRDIGCSKAIKHLTKVGGNVLVKTVEKNSDHVARLHEYNLIQNIVDHVEKVHKCAVDVNMSEFKSNIEKSHVKEQCWQISSGCTIHIVCGDWTQLKVDALLVAVNEQFEPHDSLSRRIIESGGKTVKEEIASCQIDQKELLPLGDMVSIKSGLTQAKMLFCVCLAARHEFVISAITKALQTSLHKCSIKGLLSLAVPAFDCKDIFGETEEIVKIFKSGFGGDLLRSLKDLVLLSTSEEGYRALVSYAKQYLPGKETLPEDATQERRSEVAYSRSNQRGDMGEPKQKMSAASKKITVKVIKGTLAQQTEDVIVNTVAPSLNLSEGAISSSILTAGGPQLQDVCNTKRPKVFLRGNFLCTPKRGRLKCKEVYHCCLPDQRDPKGSTVFQNMLKEMLNDASVSGHTSIAFPALGTGNLGYKAEDVAKWIFGAIKEHQTTTKTTSLKEVVIVIYHSDTKSLLAFQSCLDVWNGGNCGNTPCIGTRTFAEVAGTKNKSNKQGNIHIEVAEASIVHQQVDVIVNTVDNLLQLSTGKLSKSILQAAGDKIQTECDKKYRHQTPLADGNFVVTKAGHLPCNFIYHACLPWYDDPYSKKLLKKIVWTCLKKASEHKSTCIAFPALGTGNLGYPKSVVAQIMFDTVRQFEKQEKATSLKKVVFAVYKDKTAMEEFKKEYEKHGCHPPTLAAIASGEEGGASAAPHDETTTKPVKFGIAHLTVALKQGDILTEETDSIVLTVPPSLNLRTGTITQKLLGKLKYETEPKLKGAIDRERMRQDGLVIVSSFELCKAKTLIFLNRELVKSNQQKAIQKCLQLASRRDNYSVAFPILATGSETTNASKMAVDLFEAVNDFAVTQATLEGTLQNITVVVYDPKMFTAFKKKYEELMPPEGPHRHSAASRDFRPRRPAPPIPTKQHLVHSLSNTDSAPAMSPESTMKVVYEVASDCHMCITSALASLKQLSVDSSHVIEKVYDDRLMDIHDDKKRSIEDLSREYTVKMKVDKHMKFVEVAGKSFNVCQALRHVMNIVSPLSPICSHVPRACVQTTRNDEDSWLSSGMSADHGNGKASKSDNRKSESFDQTGNGYPNLGSHKLADTNISDNNQHMSSAMSAAFPQQDVRPKTPKTKISANPCFEYIDETKLHGSGEWKVTESSSMENRTPSYDDHEKNSYKPEALYHMEKNEENLNNSISEMHMYDVYPKSVEGGVPTPMSELTVEWFLVDDTVDGKVLQSYDPMSSKIETAYQNGEKDVVLPGEQGDVYVIDFLTMEEFIKEAEEDRVPVIRREKLKDETSMSEVSLPEHLRNLGPSGVRVAMVDRSSQEFSDVRDQFTKDSQELPVSIVKIEKMLNVKLYENYEKKKQLMESMEGRLDTYIEHKLWHGPLVNTDTIVNMSNFGFNRSYCRSGEESDLGEGVYFYPDIHSIMKNSKADASGHHHVCLSKVLTGKTAVGKQELRDPPMSSDSVVDVDSLFPSKFAVFFDNQALPEYLVTFTV